MTRLPSTCVVALLLGACVPPLPGTPDEAAPGAGGAGAETCSPACTTRPGCAPAPITTGLVAGFDSGCAVVEKIDGRDGSWSFSDGASMGAAGSMPIPMSCQAASGCYSACLRGTLGPSGTPGPPAVVLAATLRANGAPYDATRYRGIAFHALGVLGDAQLLFLVAFERGDPFVAQVPGFQAMTNHRLGFERIEIDFPTQARLVSLQWELVASGTPGLDDDSTICLDAIELLPR